jgi:large subunit ribosomal protein L30
MKQIKVTLTRSLIGRPKDQRATVKALGLGKMQSSALKNDTPAIRGMIRKVEHLLTVEEIVATDGKEVGS